MEGKAKEAFEGTLKNINSFNKLSEQYKNRKRIEFFNNVGIKMTFRKAKLGGCTCYFSNEFDDIGIGYNSEEIRVKAIKKAVEIYNEKYKEQ
ncbi:hypothetical protein ACH34C_07070 [Elizabethkingia anophelis]|uniref:hypothetical protein n=1 Tax=Elizabethkingia anophelis TaxID=1117645 RepID=UPI003786FB23